MPPDHLDHELLSDVVDGAEPDGAAAEHLASCEPCTERLRGMRGAAELFASPVAPLAAAVVDAMVERATSAPVIPLASRRRPARGGQWVAAVAAVIALLVGLPLLLRAGGDATDDRSALATADDRDVTSSELRATESNDTGGGSGAAALSDEGAETLSQSARAATGAAGPPPAGMAHLGSADDPDQLVSVVRARMSTGEAGSDQYKSAGDGEDAPRCEDRARDVGAGRLGSLPYAALVDWKGVAAEVLVFDLTEPAAGFTRQAYVMARRDCAVLADPRF